MFVRFGWFWVFELGGEQVKRLACGLDADARYDMVVGDYQEAGGKSRPFVAVRFGNRT